MVGTGFEVQTLRMETTHYVSAYSIP